MSHVIPIPKPNKDHTDPSNYRPISLLSSLSKIFERIILKRLSNFININDIIPNEQFGFRQGHSTSHQIHRMKNYIKNALTNQNSVGTIILDVEKAFDCVWHNGLIYKMINLEIPLYIIKIIQCYLSNRSFKVSIKKSKSRLFDVPAGVPQGSVLSPTLFNIFTYDIPHPLDCSLFLYADDTAILTKSVYAHEIIVTLENGLQDFYQYYFKWKIKINVRKTQAMFFTKRTSIKYLPNRNILSNNVSIPWDVEIKYLGVTMDKSLTFYKHIQNSITKSNLTVKILYSFINRKSKLSNQNKIIMFKTIFRAILTYGCNVWGHCAETHLKKLQIAQNKILKIIYNLPRHHSTTELHEIDNMDMIKHFIQKLEQKYHASIITSDNPLISEMEALIYY